MTKFFIPIISLFLFSTSFCSSLYADSSSGIGTYKRQYTIAGSNEMSEAEAKEALSQTPFVYGQEESMYDAIIRIINEIKAEVWDLNGDGKINCIDKAILFKAKWDAGSKYRALYCNIFRNYNKDKNFHHLFIYIEFAYNGEMKYVAIEPGAVNPKAGITMYYNWGDTYDPEYNYENENAKWMSAWKYK